MSLNFTAKSFYIFLFVLPLLFYTGIADTTLLPRQLALTVFTLLLAMTAWRIVAKENTPQPIDSPNLALLAYLLIATVISIANAKVLSESFYALSKLYLIVSFSLVTATLLKNNIITQKHIIGAMMVFGCVSIATALVDMSERGLKGQYIFVELVSGGFGNKNLLSSILFLCLPFFMIGIRENRWRSLVSIAALIAAIIVLVTVRTRTTLIAVLIFFGIIAFYYLADHFKRRIWVIVGALFSLAVVAVFVLKSYFSDSKYIGRIGDIHTLHERALFWQNSWKMFLEHPFGVGLGNWQVYFPKYGLEKFDSFAIENGINTVQRPHNDFLWSLCETGVLGFAAYLAIFGIIIYQSFKLVRSAVEKEEKWFSICLFAGLIGFVIISFVDFPMERIEHLVALMLIFALVNYRYGMKFKSFALPVKGTFVILFLIAGVVVSFVVSSRRLTSEKTVFKMDLARKSGNSEEVLILAQHADSYLYKIDSKTMPLTWYKGVAQFSKQGYAESAASFQNAYELTPYNIHVINNLASNYEVNGNRNEAIRFYLKALEISPEFEEARLNLAAVYFNNKDYAKAFETIDRCDVNTRDPKYQIFLPPILKAKIDLVFQRSGTNISDEMVQKFSNAQYFLRLYYESKENNITFEKQIINNLKTNL